MIRLRCSCWDFYLQCTVWSLFIFKIFSHFFFVFNSIATQARCDARHADFFIFIFFFYFISFFLSFCARFQLVPWAGDLCTIEFWVGVRELFFNCYCYISWLFFVDLVAWLFVGFFWFDFGGSWAYINIWVPYSRLRCVLAHVHSLCSSHDWGKCLLCFLLCFFAFALGALEHYINLRGGCDNTSGCGLV